MANYLEIEVGMLLEVLTENNEVLFRARVTDFDGDSIRIENDMGGSVPMAMYNSEYKLRGHLSDDRRVVYHGTVCGSTATMWKLDQLANWFTWEKREFFRQNISVEAVLTRIKWNGDKADDPLREEDDYNCKLLDVSGGGVLIACDATFSVGDQLRVGNAEILPDTEPFSFRCSVRRASEARYTNLYGCQFVRMSPNEQDRLVRAIFRLQREEAKRLRGKLN